MGDGDPELSSTPNRPPGSTLSDPTPTNLIEEFLGTLAGGVHQLFDHRAGEGTPLVFQGNQELGALEPVDLLQGRVTGQERFTPGLDRISEGVSIEVPHRSTENGPCEEPRSPDLLSSVFATGGQVRKEGVLGQVINVIRGPRYPTRQRSGQ